ncbi:type II toxin-antitoxin system RelE/ParE family toxin [uncultured Algoriphagus sp.]|uniref:type II toxin-antitoxin system RelE/ParE family toxin n=1 Tax=uncultured Algoriphagus sp. TaxID=417365 RepID=UPI0030EC6297|tara:strand:- start:8448 stop:8744 length:297 start_codon:yes stop_codon:yes gene_type:complete
MGAYKLSARCDEDIANIYEFGIEHFGLKQAKEYIFGLHESFESIAMQNFMGLDASELTPELRRLTFKSHMIFYYTTDYGAFIIRVLHQSMDYQRQLSK